MNMRPITWVIIAFNVALFAGFGFAMDAVNSTCADAGDAMCLQGLGVGMLLGGVLLVGNSVLGVISYATRPGRNTATEEPPHQEGRTLGSAVAEARRKSEAHQDGRQGGEFTVEGHDG